MAETTVRVAEGPALVLAGYDGEPLTSLAAYRAVGGYEQLEQARAQDPQAVIQELIESNLPGRGGGFFHRRRVAARHLQGPGDHAQGSAPPDRGLPHRGPRDPVEAGLHLHPGRVQPRVRGAAGRA